MFGYKGADRTPPSWQKIPPLTFFLAKCQIQFCAHKQKTFLSPFKAIGKRENVLRGFAILYAQTISIEKLFEEEGPHLKTGIETFLLIHF
jgi:hypothetical protein